MSVQSRRKPSKLFTATVWGLLWAAPLIIAYFFVRGTLQEIRNQAVEGAAGDYIGFYVLALSIFVVGVLWRVRRIDDSKGQYLAIQLVFFILFVAVFMIVLPVVAEGGKAFFLGNPEPGVLSTYEAFYILLLCTFGVLLLALSVMNDKHRNEIRIGVGGILFVISILLPKALESYELLRAMCASRLLEESYDQAGCPAEAIETIPMFTMAIAFSAALTVLFFVSMLSPTVERFISSQTGDDTGTQRNLPKQESETAVRLSSAEPLPSAVRRNSHCGSFTAAVLGGVVVWAIQAIGERATKRR